MLELILKKTMLEFLFLSKIFFYYPSLNFLTSNFAVNYLSVIDTLRLTSKDYLLKTISITLQKCGLWKTSYISLKIKKGNKHRWRIHE